LACKSRLRTIGTKAAPHLIHLTKVAKAKAVIDEHIDEALNELATIDPADYGSPGIVESVETAGKANSKPVGRRKKATVKRKRGRARKVANK
jgi:hypothetical protein